MDYQEIKVWTIIKRFLIGWAIVGGIITVISCIKYKEYIITALTNNITAWIIAILPCAIVLYGIVSIIKTPWGRN
ncbi:MAG: hypothetical protein K6G88_03790 [Lachnospiraceae bacterium]|nr:hypothetical protein [Lachnospiraceae bacterium]